jgi:nucleotide-binding universal stress UspA family protein
MTTVLAALDTSAAARPVLETACRLAELTGSEVEAVHVHTDPAEHDDTPEGLAERAGVPLTRLPGPVEEALLGALEAPGVVAMAIGAHGLPDGRRLVGHTAATVLERAGKPLVVVPAEAVSPSAFTRLLAPLEGTERSTRPVVEQLLPLLGTDLDLLVLHVYDEATLPPMLDHPEYDLRILGGEFLARHFPASTRIELRTGSVAERVTEVADEQGVDLIVMSWSQDPSPERARTVREVLRTTRLPVLLVPAGPSGSYGPTCRPGTPAGTGTEAATAATAGG